MEPSDALAVVLVLRADEPARFERAIVRWRALLCHEARGLGASEAQLMLAALQALCGPAAAPAGRLLAELRTRHAARRQRRRRGGRPGGGSDRAHGGDQRMVATGGRARRGAYRIRTGVPIGMRRASRLIGRLATRMQPWDGQPGIRYGWSVPWMPTTPPPPPGQALRLE